MLWPHRRTLHQLLKHCSYKDHLAYYDNELDHLNTLAQNNKRAVQGSNTIDEEIVTHRKSVRKEAKLLLLGGFKA